MSKLPNLHSKADRDRVRQRGGEHSRRRKRIETVVDKIIEEHLVHGRPAQACMADLVRAAKEGR